MTRSRLFLVFSLAAVAVTVPSCDKHSWEETKVLQEKYGEHGGDHGEGHGAAADSHGAGHEAKPEAHGEKK